MPCTCRTCYIESLQRRISTCGTCWINGSDRNPHKHRKLTTEHPQRWTQSSLSLLHEQICFSQSPCIRKPAFLFSAALKPTELTQSQSPFIRIAQRAAWKKHCKVDMLAISYRTDSSQLLAASLRDASPCRRKVSCKQIHDSYSVRVSIWKPQFTHVLGQCEYVLIESTEACCIATCILLEIWNSIDCRAADFVCPRKTSQEGPWKIFSDSSVTLTRLVWAWH